MPAHLQRLLSLLTAVLALVATEANDVMAKSPETDPPPRTIDRHGVSMVLVPAGYFMMGSESGGSNEKPVHRVYVDAIYMDKYRVTNTLYARFLNEYGRTTDENGNIMIYEHVWGVTRTGGRYIPQPGYERHPVTRATWYGAHAYVRYYGMRLPTEAEWEKAALTGSDGNYCFGDMESQPGPDNGISTVETQPVGRWRENSLGIFGLHGNMGEWCSDWYAKNYYTSSSTRNPRGPASGKTKSLRGGVCVLANRCRATDRSHLVPHMRCDGFGFRRVVSTKER